MALRRWNVHVAARVRWRNGQRAGAAAQGKIGERYGPGSVLSSTSLRNRGGPALDGLREVSINGKNIISNTNPQIDHAEFFVDNLE